MAVNPMQRKANNSFLLGILITLLITGVIIVLLLMQVSKLNKEKQEEEALKIQTYVLATDVKSGEILDSASLKPVTINKSTIPENAITSTSELEDYGLCDSEGRTIINQGYNYILVLSGTQRPVLVFDDEIGKYYYMKDKASGKVITTSDEGQFMLMVSDEEKIQLNYNESSKKYYYTSNNTMVSVELEKTYIELDSKTVIAKVDLKANTVLTSELLAKGELLASDIRNQEYNIITLPTQITTGEYVDVRLRLPNGQDYIVVSHKQATIPTIEGIDSLNCIWLELSEVDILNMSCAIVEAYKMNGAVLYATRYVEPGLQDAATVTYLPSDEVIALMNKDPNAVQKAKNALFARVNNNEEKQVIRNPINSAVKNDDADDNLQEGVQNEIQGLQDEREKYLESLGM